MFFDNDPIRDSQPCYSFAEVRKTYPHAYERWARRDDNKLKGEYHSSKVAELAKAFGRTKGAIESRIQHFLDESHIVFDPGFDPMS